MKKEKRTEKNIPLVVAMIEAGLSQRELAEKVGLHELTISKVVNEQLKLSQQTAQRVAGVLNSVPEALNLVPGKEFGINLAKGCPEDWDTYPTDNIYLQVVDAKGKLLSEESLGKMKDHLALRPFSIKQHVSIVIASLQWISRSLPKMQKLKAPFRVQIAVISDKRWGGSNNG